MVQSSVWTRWRLLMMVLAVIGFSEAVICTRFHQAILNFGWLPVPMLLVSIG